MAPHVRLAGYNLDADLIQDLLDVLQSIEREAGSLPPDQAAAFLRSLAEQIRSGLSPETFTPETISAAYARISRDPKHVTELRRAARLGVARARKSNESIIFGLGHASVAEHATFNFDVSGISRLASEELQSHRLLSFTEKSQRYITISTDYVVPPELLGTRWEQEFHAVVPEMFAAYDRIATELTKRYRAAEPEASAPAEIRELETRAKEDARYLLPLACTTQMGMTMNARNVEHVVLELSDHELAEVRQLGAAIAQAVGRLAPSLIKYTLRGTYPRGNRRVIQRIFDVDPAAPLESALSSTPTARLVESTPDGERRILRALRWTAGSGAYDGDTNPLSAEAVWQALFEGIGPHDPVLRELEVATLTFEVEISASCFAQLKRHRMMTLLSQPYGTVGGAVVPPSIVEAGLADAFTQVLERTGSTLLSLRHESPLLAPYLLTNAHRKRVLMHTNARELYHFARLRCDKHAQWEIQRLGEAVMELARQAWPNVFRLACGKDTFPQNYQGLYPSTQT